MKEINEMKRQGKKNESGTFCWKEKATVSPEGAEVVDSADMRAEM
jgi:hypothetical protein